MEERTCTKCGITKLLTEFPRNKNKRGGYERYCKVCNIARRQAWGATNGEHIQEYRRTYRKANVEALTDEDWRYYQDNAERIRARRRAHYRANAEEIGAKIKRHPLRRLWKAVTRARRRAQMSSGNNYTASQWRALCNWFDNCCLCCRQYLPLTVDHVIPLSKGGTNDIANIQPLCDTCNKSKSAKAIDYRDPNLLADFFAFLYES